ncbi:MAG: NDP-sugar synthase [Terriglobia bacterium]
MILSLGYQPRKIEAFREMVPLLGSRIHYVVEQSPLGTAGAYKNAEPLLDDATVVFNGDILCDLDLGQVIAQHRLRKATATLVLTRVENPSAYGLVETETDWRITRFLEKPGKDEITCDTINAGTYILEPDVLRQIPPGQNFSFERAVFPTLLKEKRRVDAYVSGGYWIDIGTPQKYMQVHQDLLHRRFHPPFDSSLIFGPGGSLDSDPGDSVVDSRSIVGAGAKLGRNVQIRSSCIGNNCQIGDECIIENCVVWSGVSIGANARLSGCIIGNECRIGQRAMIGSGVMIGDRSVVTDYSSLPGLTP